MGRPRIEHRFDDGVELKRCGRCEGWFPLEQFARDAKRWDGLNSTCKPCFRGISTAYRAANIEELRAYDRRYSTEHREQKSARRMAWRAVNPERDRATVQRYVERNRPLIQERDRARHAKNRDVRLAYHRAYYEANPAKRVEQVRQWRLSNPEAAAAKGVRDRARRRARLRGLPHAPWSEEQLIARDGLVCWMCGLQLGGRLAQGQRDWAVDHLIPIAVEYSGHPGDTLANLAIACHSCNRSKANKILPAAEERLHMNLAHTAR